LAGAARRLGAVTAWHRRCFSSSTRTGADSGRAPPGTAAALPPARAARRPAQARCCAGADSGRAPPGAVTAPATGAGTAPAPVPAARLPAAVTAAGTVAALTPQSWEQCELGIEPTF
jgi:hypothetical protein